MDHLTFPGRGLFITGACNNELKILLHKARLYCLMELCKEAVVNSCSPSHPATFAGHGQAAGMGHTHSWLPVCLQGSPATGSGLQAVQVSQGLRLAARLGQVSTRFSRRAAEKPLTYRRGRFLEVGRSTRSFWKIWEVWEGLGMRGGSFRAAAGVGSRTSSPRCPQSRLEG